MAGPENLLATFFFLTDDYLGSSLFALASVVAESRGYSLDGGTRASHCSGSSYCRAQAWSTQAQ